jgi:polyphenol oxidase
MPTVSDESTLLDRSSRSDEQVAGPQVLRVPHWAGEDRELDWLAHGFSTRLGGVSEINGAPSSGTDLNLGYNSRDPAETVELNRERFLGSIVPVTLASTKRGLVTLKQMHSNLVRRVGRTDIADRASLWGDGLLTNEPGVLLGIQTADCLPVLVADRRLRAVAAFHAGWRGTLKGIVERGVASMGREFGSQPADLLAAIGPGIGQCCFAVGAEVRELFSARYSYAEELFTSTEKLRLDLVEANRRQLLAAGLAPNAIFKFNECTSCRTDVFFSYRAERGKTGRMLAVIGIVHR